MNHLGRASLAILTVLLSPLAMAQSAYVDIEQRLSVEQLRQLELSPRQLQLLNHMLRDATAATIPVPGTSALTPLPTPATPEMFIGLDDTPVHSRVLGEIRGWEPGSVFVLENGQHWKVLKGQMTLRQPLQSPAIAVIPGIAGRWFLQVDEDLPKARVYRIQ